MQGEFSTIAAEIGLDTNLKWLDTLPSLLEKNEDVNLENLLYHYNILRPWGNDTRIHARDPALDVLSCAHRSTIVTLWCDPEVICQRLKARLQNIKGRRHRRRVEEILTLCQKGEHLANLYDNWYDYCRRQDAQLFFIDCSREPHMLSPAQWHLKIEKLKRS